MDILYIEIYFWRVIYKDLKRVHSILDNKEKCDIFYGDRPVWIQGVTQHVAKIGFTDNFEEKDVYIEDLYEKNLYN